MKAFLFYFCLFISVAAGLRCFTCDNARSMFMCAFRGRIRTCQNNQDSCETVVRRSGKRMMIIKRCKQKQACLENAKRQFAVSEFGFVECNRDQRNAVCTCCCQTELCNLQPHACTGMIFPCKERKLIENGDVTCSAENRPGSVCKFGCRDPGYFIRPLRSLETTCRATGEWDRPQPCCARVCPPYLPYDIVFVRQASNSEAWDEFKRRVVTIMGEFNLVNESALPGIVSYGEDVHRLTVLKFADFPGDKTLFLQKVNGIEFTQDNSSKVRTGNVLKYLLEDYFTEENGDRNSVRNVIVLQADNVSVDDVSAPADRLRKAGHKIFVVASAVSAHPEYQGQARAIAGDQQQLFIQQNPLDAVYLQDLIRELCSDPCQPRA